MYYFIYVAPFFMALEKLLSVTFLILIVCVKRLILKLTFLRKRSVRKCMIKKSVNFPLTRNIALKSEIFF